jgi:hypothetical protein
MADGNLQPDMTDSNNWLLHMLRQKLLRVQQPSASEAKVDGGMGLAG